MATLAMVWDLIARDNASAAFARVGAAAKGAAVETKAAGDESLIAGRKMDQHAKSAHGLAQGLMAIAAVDIGYRMVKSATQFQASMLLIQTQAGGTSKEVATMSKAILGLAGQVATAPEKLALSLYHVESVGLRGAKALDAVRIAAEGAKVGHADLEQTTNALTAAVASGIPGVQNLTQAMGALNAIVGAGDMKMQDLNDAMSSGILTVVKGYGLSLNDVGAALATFGDNNIRGAQAATMLRMSVQSMAVPVHAGKAILLDLGLTSEGSANALAKLHLTTNALAKDMQTGGLNKALLDLKGHLDRAGVSGVQMGQVITDAFGKRAGPGIAVLLGQMTRFESKVTQVKTGAGKFGEAWVATQKTTAFQFDKMKASVDAVGIRLGTVLLPVVTKMFDKFMQGFDYVQKHWQALKPYAEGLAVVAIAIGVVTAATALWNAVMDANPISLIIIAIAALAAGLYYAWTHFETFRDIVKGVFNAIKDAAMFLWHNVIDPFVQFLVASWKAGWQFIQGVYNDVIMPIFHGLRDAWNTLWAVISTVWGYIKPVIDTIGKVIYAVIGGIVMLVLKQLQLTWMVVWDTLVGAWRDIGKPMFDAIAAVVIWLWKNVIKPTVDTIVAGWSAVWSFLQIAWRDVGKPIFDGIATAIGWLWTHGIKPVFGWIASAWSSLWGGLGDAFSSIWGGISSAIHTGIGVIVGIINFFIKGIDWVLDKLPGHLHINTISWDQAPTGSGVGKASHMAFALGGVLPGYSPGVDNLSIPAHMFSGGEGILVPEATRALGGERGIQSINSMFSNRVSTPGHFAGGGITPSPADIQAILNQKVEGMGAGLGTGNIFTQIVNAVKGGLREVALGVLNGAEAPLKAAIGALPDGVVKSLTSGAYQWVDRGLRDLLGQHADQARQAVIGSLPAGDHLALIASALGFAGVPVNAANEAAVNLIVTNESGWNPNAINLTDSNAIAGHPSQGLMQCVSTATKILTRRGWLTHDQVRVGDETIGYNPAAGRSEWTPITKVVHYEDAPVWRIGHRNWHADVTPNHRWWSDTVVGDRGQTYRGEFVRTEEFKSRHRIRLAAPADTDGVVGLSVDDVRVLAWLQGDGHIRRTETGGYDGTIYQSKPNQVTNLRALLAHIEYGESIRPERGNAAPQHVFRLRRAYVTDLIKRSRIFEETPEEFVLALSPDQRAGWLASMIDAEGHRMPGKKPGHSEFIRIAQVDGPLQDAIRMAVYLEGWRPTYSANSAERNGYQPAGVVGMAKPHVAPSTFRPVQVLPSQTVWCVKTDLETWTAGLDGQVFLTGNTIPGTFEAYRSSALPDIITDPLANLVAGIRYAVSRYGSLSGVPGVMTVGAGHGYVGYDSGGLLMPGVTQAVNRTGSPETILTNRQMEKLAGLADAIDRLGDRMEDAVGALPRQHRDLQRQGRGR